MLLQGGNALFAQDDSGETYGDGSGPLLRLGLRLRSRKLAPT